MDNNPKIKTPQDQERACLASFIQWPHFLADFNGILKGHHFDNKVHSAIYTAMGTVYAASGQADPILLAEKLTAIGLTKIEDLNVLEYLETLASMKVKEGSVHSYVSNVLKYDFARKADKAFEEGKKEVRTNIDKPLAILAQVIDNALKKAGTEHVAEEEEAIDVFGVMQETVLKWGKEQKDVWLTVPFPLFSKLYGGLSFGDLFVFMAGAKVGKSTMVNYLAYEVGGLESNNCKVLILDTELETDRIISRNLSSLSGVNEAKIKKGTFLNNITEKNKVFAALNHLDKYKHKVFHKYIANKSIDEVIAFARRWYIQNIKQGERCLIIYDYLKSTQENIGSAFESFEVLGMKTDRLKKLASELPNTACVTCVQTNRQGQAAMSSQIEWHCSNLYRLEKKTPEEITDQGKEFGTHKLIEIRARVQGDEAQGFDNYVKQVTQDGEKWVENFINFKIENFHVTECGGAADVFNKQLGQIDVTNTKHKSGPVFL